MCIFLCRFLGSYSFLPELSLFYCTHLLGIFALISVQHKCSQKRIFKTFSGMLHFLVGKGQIFFSGYTFKVNYEEKYYEPWLNKFRNNFPFDTIFHPNLNSQCASVKGNTIILLLNFIYWKIWIFRFDEIFSFIQSRWKN